MTDMPDLCRDIQMQLPDQIWMLDSLSRYRAGACYTTDFASINGHFYLFGVVTVPLSYVEDEFTWGCWVEVDKSLHDAYLAAYQSELADTMTGEGVLANEIPSYTDSLGAKVQIQFFSNRRPAFTVDVNTTLGTEQAEGLTAEAHQELDRILFPDDDDDTLEDDFE